MTPERYDMRASCRSLADEILHLRAINADLLAALEAVLNSDSDLQYHGKYKDANDACRMCAVVAQARTAILKARGS